MTFQARSRAARLGVITGAALCQLLNAGCPPPVRVSLCSTYTRDTVTRQTFRFDSYVAPFSPTDGSRPLRVCGSPPSRADVLSLWNGLLLDRLAEICDPAHPEYPTYRDRLCPASRWCFEPGTSSCSPNDAATTDCTPPATPRALPACPPAPAEIDPRICTDSTALVFPPTNVWETSTAALTLRHCGGGQLVVRHPRDWIFSTRITGRTSFDDPALEPTWSCDPPLTAPDERPYGGVLLGPGSPRDPAGCTVTFRFRPDSPGTKEATVYISNSDPRQTMLPIELSGRGVANAGFSFNGSRLACGATTRVCFDDTHTDPVTAPGACPAARPFGRERTVRLRAESGPVLATRLAPALVMPTGEWRDVSEPGDVATSFPHLISTHGTLELKIRRCFSATPVEPAITPTLYTDDTCGTHSFQFDSRPGCSEP